MTEHATKMDRSGSCPSPDIAAYIDGELDAERERCLDAHLYECAVCSAELNSQKQFLLCLDAGLKEQRELELPASFARRVAVNAEANVSGLRRPSEFFNSIFICIVILLFILFASGADADKVLSGSYLAFDQLLAVGGVFGHLIYDLFLGVAIVIRAFATQFRPDVLITILLSSILAAPTIFLSRKVLRVRRA